MITFISIQVLVQRWEVQDGMQLSPMSSARAGMMLRVTDCSEFEMWAASFLLFLLRSLSLCLLLLNLVGHLAHL